MVHEFYWYAYYAVSNLINQAINQTGNVA